MEMTVKELKELLKDIPDDYKVKIYDQAWGDFGYEGEFLQIDRKRKEIVL